MGGQCDKPDTHICPIGGAKNYRAKLCTFSLQAPSTDTMAAVESGARRLSPEDADDLRGWIFLLDEVQELSRQTTEN